MPMLPNKRMYVLTDSGEMTVVDTAKGAALPNGVPQFVQNLVFGVGVGMFLPTSFEYKYTR